MLLKIADLKVTWWNFESKSLKNTYEEVYFQQICRFLATNFTKNKLPHSYLSRILTADFRTIIFCNTTRWLLLNKINKFHWMVLLIAIFTISFWLWQITVTEVAITIIVMGFIITVFTMISFFFSRAISSQ